MTADEARDLLLVRSFERSQAPPWHEARGRAATAEATRRLAQATPQQRVVQRAALAAQQLIAADAGIGDWVRSLSEPHWFRPVLLALALLGGLAIDRIGASGRINILAPPLLAMIAWNLCVYLVLVAGALRSRSGAHWGERLQRWGLHRTAPAVAADTRRALAAFSGQWFVAAAPLVAARVGATLHLAAALLAATALASMYARGLVFEYRAGWDSTFLDPAAVHGLLVVLLGPAAALIGIELPAAEELARLRFSLGPGENAARWIHLYAVTTVAIVVLPRLVLAASAGLRAGRLRRDFPLAIDALDLAAFVPDAGGAELLVLPYAHQDAPRRQAALRDALARHLGTRVTLRLADNLALGDEDRDDALQRLGDGPTRKELPVVLLFAMSATPEREHHVAFAAAVRDHDPTRPMVIIVDATGFAAGLDPSLAQARIEQRSAAWREAFASLSGAASVPMLFENLGAASAAQAAARSTPTGAATP